MESRGQKSQHPYQNTSKGYRPSNNLPPLWARERDITIYNISQQCYLDIKGQGLSLPIDDIGIGDIMKTIEKKVHTKPVVGVFTRELLMMSIEKYLGM